jgi:7,8-dihydro-6-hydroxymethylpterin-pyrophosphokinase
MINLREVDLDLEATHFLATINLHSLPLLAPHPEIEQRSHLLLLVSDTARSQIHPLGQCTAQGSEAEQSAAKYDM